MKSLPGFRNIRWISAPQLDIKPLTNPLRLSILPQLVHRQEEVNKLLLQRQRLEDFAGPVLKTTTTLDRIQAFRRRQESPSPSREASETRGRSPSWFQRMQRNSSSSKRSRSASAQPETPTDTANQNATAPNGAARDAKLDPPLKMPAFLQQSQGGK
jgi:hypothetical protein